MALELLYEYRKPGFPKFQTSEKSYSTSLEYVGPYSQLYSEQPGLNEAWGDYIGVVTNVRLSPIEGTEKAELFVDMEYTFDSGTATFEGDLREVTFEVEWVMYQRSMYEHPAFAIGGGGTYELDSDDIAAIEIWKNETNAGARGSYQYTGGTSFLDLSTNAKMFARGIELGQETFEDFVPVIRKTSTYVNGNPGESTAGAKGGDPTFTGKPNGYEWRKTADRAVRSKGQARWDRVEEWIGAETVLHDKAAIYWSAPA